MGVVVHINREQHSLRLEYGQSLFTDGANVSANAIKALIIKYPLDRFVIQGFLTYDKPSDTISFVPQLWHELRYYELLDILTLADEQLAYYYNRKA